MMKNDAERIMITQIGYLNSKATASEPQNVGQLVNSILNDYGVFNPQTGTYELRSGVGGEAAAQFKVANEMMQLSEQNHTYSWQNWNIVDVHDTNSKNGFYGCVIDTNDGDAVVACRGSESFDLQSGVLDWGAADVGRLNNKMTFEQAEARRYMQEIENNPALNKYNSYDFVGHSLGGSLATSMAIYSSDEFKERINRVDSLDGPGFSSEFLTANMDAIAKLQGKMYHVEWSWVGSLLMQPMVGEPYIRVIQANDGEGMLGHLTSHDPKYVILDENGNVIDGKRGYMQWIDMMTGISMYDIASDFSLCVRLFAFLYIVSNVVDYFWEGIKIKAAQEIGKVFSSIMKSVGESLRQLADDVVSYAVTGEYDVSLRYLTDTADHLSQVEKEMKKIIDEIDSIRRDLPYLSVAGNGFKSGLYAEETKMEMTSLSAKRLSRVAEAAAKIYSRADHNAEAHLTVN